MIHIKVQRDVVGYSYMANDDMLKFATVGFVLEVDDTARCVLDRVVENKFPHDASSHNDTPARTVSKIHFFSPFTTMTPGVGLGGLCSCSSCRIILANRSIMVGLGED